MSSYRCDPRLVHCFLNGQSECECGAERHDHVLAETFALAWGISCPGLASCFCSQWAPTVR